MTDYKQLCAELLEELALWLEYDGPPSRLPEEEDESCQLLARSRAALAEPELEGPTREQAVAIYSEVMATHECQTLGEMAEHFTHAVLARWGNHPGSPDSSTQSS